MNRGEEWKEGKLKHLAVIRNGQDYKEVVSESGIYPVYGSGGVFAKATDFLYDGKSVLFGRKGTIDKPRLAAGRFWTVDTMFYSEIDRHACPEFVYHVATTIPYSLYSTSTALPSMTQDDLKNHAVLIPSFTEQRQIATYLNRETAKIDKLIVKQQKLIKLLQEKRQAVISQAVTKGLDPNVKMKDSGVEWLGEVPEHWNVKKLKYVCRVTTGNKDTQDAVEDGEFPFFVRSQTIERINSYSFEGEGVLTAGDGAGVGKVFHHHVGKLAFHQRVYLLYSFSGYLPRLMFHHLREHFYNVALGGQAKSTVDSLRMPIFLNFEVPIPPSGEQKKILENIEDIQSKYQQLILKANIQIDLLKEHRQALITAAVTGKIDVRGLVTDEEVAALDAEPEAETTEQDLASEVLEDTYITEEE